MVDDLVDGDEGPGRRLIVEDERLTEPNIAGRVSPRRIGIRRLDPFVPQPVDIRVMGEKDRVERRGREHAHVRLRIVRVDGWVRRPQVNAAVRSTFERSHLSLTDALIATRSEE